MQAHGFVHFPQSLIKPLLACAAGALLAACGNTTVNFGGGSSSGSSGGGGGTLHGTFFGYTGNSTRGFPSPSTQKDTVFGVIAGDGTGFLADTQVNGSQAIFNLAAASSTGSTAVSGFFIAYAGGSGNLGDGSTQIALGNLSGTITSSSSVQADLNFPFPGTYSNNAHVVLDTPALVPSAIPTGTYAATTGSAAVSAKGFPILSTTYTVAFTSATSFTLSSISGCNFSGTASADGTYNVSHLSASGNCGSGTVTLTGLASFLPKNGHSPLGGSLTADTLVLELDDSDNSASAHQYALVLVATKQ